MGVDSTTGSSFLGATTSGTTLSLLLLLLLFFSSSGIEGLEEVVEGVSASVLPGHLRAHLPPAKTLKGLAILEKE